MEQFESLERLEQLEAVDIDVDSRIHTGSNPGIGLELNGVTQEFIEIYEAKFLKMVRLAFLLTGSEEIAEDLVQDSFARMYLHWRTVKNPEPYIRRSVVNACSSYHRRSWRDRTRLDGHEPSAPSVDPRESSSLSVSLGKLPSRQRSAIVLRYYADLSDGEIASVLGCRIGTVSSLIYRGLESLRKVVEV